MDIASARLYYRAFAFIVRSRSSCVRVPMGKPIGYHIGHRYATLTYVATTRQSRVAMTYVVALGASPMKRERAYETYVPYET
jgi:hypothetical protein